MRHEHYTLAEHGFVGHLAEPDAGSKRAAIVVMGGEQSLLPGIKFAERFADFGITGLAVSLFGADGLPDSPDRIPLELVEAAARLLREGKGISHLSIYGQSMGSIFAALAAEKIDGFENLILVSPTHVPFEGTFRDKKTMTGHSVATWRGEELPFVRADFSRWKTGKYYRHSATSYPVTGMWCAYHEAYQDRARSEAAILHPERCGARILMIAGEMDEAWPSMESVSLLQSRLRESEYPHDVKTIVYPHGSHLTGLMPNREREKKLYRMIPLIGLMYRTFGKYRKENLNYFAQSEQAILRWIMEEDGREREMSTTHPLK